MQYRQSMVIVPTDGDATTGGNWFWSPIKINRSHPCTSVGSVALSIHCAASSTSTVLKRISSFPVNRRNVSLPAPIHVLTITSAANKTRFTQVFSISVKLFFASPNERCTAPRSAPPVPLDLMVVYLPAWSCKQTKLVDTNKGYKYKLGLVSLYCWDFVVLDKSSYRCEGVGVGEAWDSS